jgi:hypothetical protein
MLLHSINFTLETTLFMNSNCSRTIISRVAIIQQHKNCMYKSKIDKKKFSIEWKQKKAKKKLQ